MVRRLMSLLIVFALMACFGAMMPTSAQAEAPTAMHMTASEMTHAGCSHHNGAHMACHDCPICAGAAVPDLAASDNRVATPARLPTPGYTAHLTGVRPAGLDRPPRQQA